MTRLPLACTVRDCGLPLGRVERTFVCPRGHSYDVARSGYVNLLQPQDRRSRTAGDTKEAVAARARLLAAGVGRSILQAVIDRVDALNLPEGAVVAELGSGSGDALGAVAEAREVTVIGMDLSIAAAEHAARRFPDLTWVVANADRRLPLLDTSVDLVMSLHARRNPVECARVLIEGGFLLVVVPAPDDLIELRAMVLGQSIERERADALLVEHAPRFSLVDRSLARERQHLERNALRDLLRGTYRGERLSAAERVNALDALDVTLASELLVMRRVLS